jgi:hypothetical protein
MARITRQALLDAVPGRAIRRDPWPFPAAAFTRDHAVRTIAGFIHRGQIIANAHR